MCGCVKEGCYEKDINKPPKAEISMIKRTMQSGNTMYHFAQIAYLLVTYGLSNKYRQLPTVVRKNIFLYNGDVLHSL